MYKLFLCLRYLRSRIIAYFAVLAVALCVAMVLIVVSVMNGFLNKIENAAKGIFGHVTISAGGLGGLGRYEDLSAELKRKVPEVEATTPFIATVGLLRIPGYDYRKDVQVVGIRLSDGQGRPGGATDFFSDVSDFRHGLFVQRGSARPTFDPPDSLVLERLADDISHIQSLAAADPGDARLEASARTALGFHYEAEESVRSAPLIEQKLKDLRGLQEQLAQAGGREGFDPSPIRRRLVDILDDLSSRFPEFISLRFSLTAPGPAGADKLSDILDNSLQTLEMKRFEGPDRRVILGLGISGLIYRTQDGQTLRKIVAGDKIVLSLVPLGRKSAASTSITPVTVNFSVIDDCRTDVWTIDSNYVYLPFETLQKLNDMDNPLRCSQLLLRVKPACSDGRELMSLCARIQAVVDDFHARHPDMTVSGDAPTVSPWMERLADAINMLQKQRTLSVTMFGIISMVSVVLIFVIFYMIVVQKTRDIGVLKALGASNVGVAEIFLAYGAAIGLVGSILGAVGGYYFVRYINEIQDAFDRWFGFRVWEKESFLFERIPNDVKVRAVLIILAGAVAAGLVGAILPAIRAARMQPVEALRYE